MTSRRLRPVAYLLALAALWCATQWMDGMTVGWLALAPALLLLVPLLSGRYLGESALRRLAGRRAAPPRRAPVVSGLWHVLATTPHGGQLLARRVAGRAPPRGLLLR